MDTTIAIITSHSVMHVITTSTSGSQVPVAGKRSSAFHSMIWRSSGVWRRCAWRGCVWRGDDEDAVMMMKKKNDGFGDDMTV